MATRVPFALKDIEYPEWSSLSSPLMSLPTCTQLFPVESKSYTRTCPDLLPLPSLCVAPMATRFPSALKDTDHPDSSPVASPSMSLPTCTQLFPDESYTRTCPEPSPFPSLYGAPMATRVPFALKDTDHPYWSPAALPLMSLPTCSQLFPVESKSYTRTCPELLLPLP